MRIIVREKIDKLPAQEQCVVYGAFYENKTIEDIARELGWSLISFWLRMMSYGCPCDTINDPHNSPQRIHAGAAIFLYGRP